MIAQINYKIVPLMVECGRNWTACRVEDLWSEI